MTSRRADHQLPAAPPAHTVRDVWYVTYRAMRKARREGMKPPSSWTPRDCDTTVCRMTGATMPVYDKQDRWPGALGKLNGYGNWTLYPSVNCGGAAVDWAKALMIFTFVRPDNSMAWKAYKNVCANKSMSVYFIRAMKKRDERRREAMLYGDVE